MTDEAQVQINSLDDALSYTGEPITLTRTLGRPPTTTTTTVNLYAFIRGYLPSDLWPGSGITQQDQLLITSPTPIIAAAWGGSAGPGDPHVPRQGDRVTSSRGTLTVQAAAGIYSGATLVRIEMQVRGT